MRYPVFQTKDHGYLSTGYSRSYPPGIHNVYLVKFDSNGNTCTQSTPGPVTYDSTTLVGSGGTVTIYGYVYDTNATVVNMVSVDSDLCNVTTSTSSIKLSGNAIDVFPNPFSNSTTVLLESATYNGQSYLELYDLTGRLLKQAEFTGNTYSLSAEGLAKGMYFIRIFDKDNNVVGASKIVI